MKPVLIVQPDPGDGPAYLASWLSGRGQGFELRQVHLNHAIPTHALEWSAIAILGGPMSVNDDLAFLRASEALVQDALTHAVPVLGHCLGGQLLAKVLGAAVTDNPEPEIGWSLIKPEASVACEFWLGDALEPLPVYQWHYQTFALPRGASLLAGNAVCANQVFCYGPHLGMQFHIEVDAPKLAQWATELPPPGDARYRYASVQNPEQMRADTGRWLAQSQALARQIYSRWLCLAKSD